MDQRWYEYLYAFHSTRDYYACHDYLEEWWFELKNPKDHILVAYIQVAVGMYQWRRGNINAARIMFQKASEKFLLNTNDIGTYGMDETSMHLLMERLLKSVNDQDAFYDINLPIIDFEMEDELYRTCEDRNTELYVDSNLSNDELINKHLYKNKTSE